MSVTERQVEILRRLLHLARRGQIGAVYCFNSRLEIGIGPRVLGETRPLKWSEANRIAKTWVDRKPMNQAVVASTKRIQNSPGARKQKQA